jgi:divalent metal cation (Fe/Co/Zn/Cd) transporter
LLGYIAWIGAPYLRSVRFDSVRSRRSGTRIFIEVALGFDGRLAMTEVTRRIAALTATMHGEITDADIIVLASSHEA